MRIRQLTQSCHLAIREPGALSKLISFVCTVCFSSCVFAQDVSFREQIQPILAEHCFACHGPDEKQRQADLRLDLEDSAKESAILAGDAQNSELIDHIESNDETELMPPPEFKKPLSEAQKQTLRRWIDQGAKWERHWAFEPIASSQPPVDDSHWAQNEIDQFVRQRMQTNGLYPAPPADRRTLIRRAYFDLIGIGPTPEQVAAFVDDTDKNAFEKVVDGLMSSRHYGEQMAVAWLDAARFADTNGYQNDFVRSMWPWRDWVIEAFNRNIPYDEFILEQLAGDMLPNPTQSQLVASGFNRNNHSVTEGGSIEEEWRIENCIDRVETTAATFLGLTMGCARCHDHKYDPISQKEFYEFFAFFNNIDERGVYNETRGNVEPLIRVPTTEQIAQLAEVDMQLEAKQKEFEVNESTENRSAAILLKQWQQDLADKQTIQPTYEFLNPAGMSPAGRAPAGTYFELPGEDNAAGSVDQPVLSFERDQPFSWSAWVHGSSRGSIFAKMDEGSAYRGVDAIILDDSRLKIHLISNWKVNAVAVISKTRLVPDEWNHVTVTYDGKSKAAGYKIYLDGTKVDVDVDLDTLSESIENEVPFKIGQRTNSEFLKGQLSLFRLYDRELSADDVLLLLKEAVVANQKRDEKLELNHDKVAYTRYLQLFGNRGLLNQIGELQSRREKLISQQQTTMVMRERSEYRETYRLNRGQYDQPDTTEKLWPAIPMTLPTLTNAQPANRLGLALWMVDERNPLVARVAVNRAWAKFFGRGPVETANNFGIQGSPPTHPLLLDWLADDFRKNGWNLKRLHKQILMSATYQQASDLTAEKLELDRDNRWYSRGPRHRLSAEQIRDNALATSGLLVERQGGPSVFPYQPDGLWEELAGGASNGPYKRSSGNDLYRRSLYTYRKRTVSHPTTASFDAPNWEICQVKRSRTNTPLQALALLNDTTYVEAAKKFAERILRHGGQELDDQIRYGLVCATSREPNANELETLRAGFNAYLDFYTANPQSATALLATGEAAVDPSLPAVRTAAMTSLASVILNLDETITKE